MVYIRRPRAERGLAPEKDVCTHPRDVLRHGVSVSVSGRVGLVKACRSSATGFYWPFGPETTRLWVRFWAAWGRRAAASPRFHGFGSGASLWRLPRFVPSVLRLARAQRGWFIVFLPAARRLQTPQGRTKMEPSRGRKRCVGEYRRGRRQTGR